MRWMARCLLAASLCAAIAYVSCSQPTSMQRVADTRTSTLKNRIPPADPNKYRSVVDARDWQNPYLMVQAKGIDARPISATTDAPTMAPADMVATWKTYRPSHGPMDSLSGAGEQHTCPRRRCLNQEEQRRASTTFGRGWGESGIVALSVKDYFRHLRPLLRLRRLSGLETTQRQSLLLSLLNLYNFSTRCPSRLAQS
jgi:hypothetical protein